jgi:hypothetical protein
LFIDLNESDVTVDFLTSIQLRDVAMVKFYPPGTAQLPRVGIAPVLAIYTKRPNGNVSSGLAHMSRFSYEGYMSQSS